MKGTTWTSKVKNVAFGIFTYCECPHCKKPIIISDEPTIKNLKKWRKKTSKTKSLK